MEPPVELAKYTAYGTICQGKRLGLSAMLAFIDSPIQIAVVFIVALVVFGPKKLPEIGRELGRALRELKRATSEFTSSINVDDRYEPPYEPPRYDNYTSAYAEPVSAGSEYPEHAQRALPAADTHRGDFAAAAMADTAADYGAPAPGEGGTAAAVSAPAAAPAAESVYPRPAADTVSRT